MKKKIKTAITELLQLCEEEGIAMAGIAGSEDEFFIVENMASKEMDNEAFQNIRMLMDLSGDVDQFLDKLTECDDHMLAVKDMMYFSKEAAANMDNKHLAGYDFLATNVQVKKTRH